MTLLNTWLTFWTSGYIQARDTVLLLLMLQTVGTVHAWRQQPRISSNLRVVMLRVVTVVDEKCVSMLVTYQPCPHLHAYVDLAFITHDVCWVAERPLHHTAQTVAYLVPPCTEPVHRL